MIQKIYIAVICNTIQEARRFVVKHFPDSKQVKGFSMYSVETDILRVDWIPTGSQGFLGWRLHYVYTTKEIYNSMWFKNVIQPMYVCGIGEIDTNTEVENETAD